MTQIPTFQRPAHVKEDPVSLAFQMPAGFHFEQSGSGCILKELSKDGEGKYHLNTIGEYGGSLAAMREAWLLALDQRGEAESSLTPPPGAKWYTMVCSSPRHSGTVRMSIYGTCEDEVVAFFATLLHDEPFEFITVIEHRQEVVDVFLHVQGSVEQIGASQEGVRVIAVSDERSDIDNEIERKESAQFAPDIDLIEHPKDLVASPWVYRLPEVEYSPCVTRFYSDYLSNGEVRREFCKKVVEEG